MTQRILHSYGNLLTAQEFNSKIEQAVPPGIYSGFRPRVSAATTNGIDLYTDGTNDSVLVTPEGVVVHETTNVSLAARVNFLATSLYRYDMLVCTYTFTSDTTVKALYDIVRGTLAEEDDIEFPAVTSSTQVPVCYIKVRVMPHNYYKRT